MSNSNTPTSKSSASYKNNKQSVPTTLHEKKLLNREKLEKRLAQVGIVDRRVNNCISESQIVKVAFEELQKKANQVVRNWKDESRKCVANYGVNFLLDNLSDDSKQMLLEHPMMMLKTLLERLQAQNPTLLWDKKRNFVIAKWIKPLLKEIIEIGRCISKQEKLLGNEGVKVTESIFELLGTLKETSSEGRTSGGAMVNTTILKCEAAKMPSKIRTSPGRYNLLLKNQVGPRSQGVASPREAISSEAVPRLFSAKELPGSEGKISASINAEMREADGDAFLGENEELRPIKVYIARLLTMLFDVKEQVQQMFLKSGKFSQPQSQNEMIESFFKICQGFKNSNLRHDMKESHKAELSLELGKTIESVKSCLQGMKDLVNFIDAEKNSILEIVHHFSNAKNAPKHFPEKKKVQFAPVRETRKDVAGRSGTFAPQGTMRSLAELRRCLKFLEKYQKSSNNISTTF